MKHLTSLLLLTLIFLLPDSASPSSAPYWSCTAPFTPLTNLQALAPGHSALRRVASTFTSLYGPHPLTLNPNQARVVICEGLLFGLWNGLSERATEAEGARESAVREDPGFGTQCLGVVGRGYDMWVEGEGGEDGDGENGREKGKEEWVEEDLRLSYMFGVAEEGWEDWKGGMTEVRTCEGGLV